MKELKRILTMKKKSIIRQEKENAKLNTNKF